MSEKNEHIFLMALEQHEQKLFRICSVYAKSTEDTKDLFQEVLLHIWQSMPTFESKSSIGTWMFRITLNVCLRFRSTDSKRQGRFVNMSGITIASTDTTEKNKEQNEQLVGLRNCIKQLNEADKAVISLYLEELPYREISKITGLTENTIAVKVKRIKKKLLNCIHQTL